MVQSIGSRSHQNRKDPFTLGNVDEYRRTEAMVGFSTGKHKRAVVAEIKRRSSFREEMEEDSRQMTPGPAPRPFVYGNHSRSVNGTGKPILIEDAGTEEVVEVSPKPDAYQGKPRKATPRPEASSDVSGRRHSLHTDSSTAEKSHYFTKTGKASAPEISAPHDPLATGSRESTPEASESANMVPRRTSQSPGRAVDDVQYLEDDSVDLIEPDGGPAGIDLSEERKSRFTNNLVNTSTISKSWSISKQGDIPESGFSKLSASRNQPRLISGSDLGFEVTYMRSGGQELSIRAGIVPWILQYDHEKKEFNVVAYIDSTHQNYPALILKPEKIHTVKYDSSSEKVFISRATEASIGAAAQVYVEMGRKEDSGRLAQSLRGLNRTIKLIPTERSASNLSEFCFSY
jgi:hypothetical protein